MISRFQSERDKFDLPLSAVMRVGFGSKTSAGIRTNFYKADGKI